MDLTETYTKTERGNYVLFQQVVGDLCVAVDIYNQANHVNFVPVRIFMMKLIMQWAVIFITEKM